MAIETPYFVVILVLLTVSRNGYSQEAEAATTDK
jgi:hypothetical protein